MTPSVSPGITTLSAIGWTPLIPLWALGLLLAALLVLTAAAALRRQPGWVLRPLPGLILLALLGNPHVVQEQRVSLPDVAFVVSDTSDSMSYGSRIADREQAAAAVTDMMRAQPGLEVRTLRVSNAPDHRGSRLLTALEQAAADVPPQRRAAAVLLTDGQIHDDAPEAIARRFAAPVHSLLAGTPGESDRRLIVVSAPAFGLVDRTVTVSVRLEDPTLTPGSTVPMTLRQDDGSTSTLDIPAGPPVSVPVRIRHGGAVVTDLSVPVRPGEISPYNNRQAVSIAGVRDRLRVLLISGEPTVGERAWRTLLKSDPNVDLVHFTILRPPLKDDGTPLNELALIAFPVQELFEERLKDFDLVIFDRYSRRALVPSAFFKLLAAYVRNGGALLLAVGPEFSEASSLYDSPLAEILPVTPTGRAVPGAFLPTLSPTGQRHPVTAALPGWSGPDRPPQWGPWLRYVDTTVRQGSTLMQTPDGAPLLVVDRVGQGRVGLVLSDTIWLWARGWQSGGPQTDLIRRTAHWLMREPDLEEEALTLRSDGARLTAERRSLSVTPPAELTLTLPDGQDVALPLTVTGPGRTGAEAAAPVPGVYRVSDGARSAVAAVAPPDALEDQALTATDHLLIPVATASGGAVRWLKDGLPALRRTAADSSRHAAGDGSWIGLRRNGETVASGVRQTPLLPLVPGLILCVGSLFLLWWREGR
ncbi:hypothetical protein [Novispirillum itersonii]|uniref:Glutamine amidotransferase domain-containing protein n=1 Tax=Novispirillum itersonii TaxID=189 RepID=A0A7W9ZCM1_NOVIT|nr:hypothetical protein [Novispirillum itersonii]MBB6209002.1 hypothetical protein [Novispirillum itersonii]